MRLKISRVGEGLHPNEVVVAVQTNEGKERMVIHKRALRDDTIEIGYPIDEDDGNYLVQLPGETMRGAGRVWVASELVVSETPKQKAVA